MSSALVYVVNRGHVVCAGAADAGRAIATHPARPWPVRRQSRLCAGDRESDQGGGFPRSAIASIGNDIAPTSIRLPPKQNAKDAR